jgi:hypothetical protein
MINKVNLKELRLDGDTQARTANDQTVVNEHAAATTTDPQNKLARGEPEWAHLYQTKRVFQNSI